MHFIFSSPITRLMFIGRFLITALLLTAAAKPLVTYGIAVMPTTSTAATASTTAPSAIAPPITVPTTTVEFPMLTAIFCGPVILVLVFYLVQFVVMPRLESIGINIWYGLLTLSPAPIGLLYYLLATNGLDWLNSTYWAQAALVLYAIAFVLLLILPDGAFNHSSVLQSILYDYEVGDGRVLIFLIPLVVAVTFLAAVYNFGFYRGLNDAQSMDNAQLARQIVRGEGYTTRFIRPQAVADLQNNLASHNPLLENSGTLFPPEQFPPGRPRILPDTYNAPGYPCLLAAWFYLVRPELNQPVSPSLDGFSPKKGGTSYVYSGDQWIPPLNLIFFLLTGLLVYMIGRKLFDDRVAKLALVSFFFTDMIWQFSLTALSTTFLMFLVTALIYCALEIFCIAEACFESHEQSFAPAWLWALPLSLLLAAACLTRLHLLVLLAPLLVLFVRMPRPSILLFIVVMLVTLGAVAPWFWHAYQVSGNPLGSNFSLLVYGLDPYKGDQIFCGATIPKYESLFRDLSTKEKMGVIWQMQHGWEMMGTNPLVLFFVASLTHAYKRRRAQMFQWFLAGTSLVLILANNIGVAQPETLSQWNILALLFPSMTVVGSAFFFIQLDRLNLQVWLLNGLIILLLFRIITLPLTYNIVPILLGERGFRYNFPPYMPPLIKLLGGYARPDEWVTTDMPWASAWYADRASLWIPDSITTFTKLYDNDCPTGILFFTPVSWSKPGSNLLTPGGEDKDWLPLVVEQRLPDDSSFPLRVRTGTPAGGPDYIIWSDRPRWSK
jgi:4-amino-4-deoxy-L-arabinose transferase-like glycosyltransferase